MIGQTRNMKQILIVLLTALLLSSCQTYTEYQVSAPSNKDMRGKGKWKRFILPNMEVAVSSSNDVKTLYIFAITVVPVYVNTTKEKYNRDHFYITVRFFPKETGFTFVPGELLLKVGNNEGIRPVKYYGPRPYSQERATFQRGISSSLWWGDEMMCGDLEYGHELYNTNCSTEANVEFPQLWNCFDLAFDIVPPDPSEDFTIKIEGLKKNGKPYDIPEIKFKQSSYGHTDSAP